MLRQYVWNGETKQSYSSKILEAQYNFKGTRNSTLTSYFSLLRPTRLVLDEGQLAMSAGYQELFLTVGVVLGPKAEKAGAEHGPRR
jgi:hypothetical protein